MSEFAHHSITVRPAAAGDVDGIARVHVAAWRETYRYLLPDTVLDGMTVPGRAAMWSRVVAQSSTRRPVFVAESAGDVVGFASGGPRRGKVLTCDGELYTVYLLRQWHGFGLGKRLVGVVAESLRGTGARSLCIWVLVSNDNARDFYEHLGGEMRAAQPFEMGGSVDLEVAYVWNDLSVLTGFR